MPLLSPQAIGYLPIATAGLCPAAVLDCDLFIHRQGRSSAQLFRGRNYPLHDDDLARLRREGVDHLYIRLNDAEAYRAYLCENVLHRRDIPATIRIKALRQITRVAFEDAMTSKDGGRVVAVASGFGRELAKMVADHSPAFCEVFKTLEHDYFTFTHVCNVSLYCALLAKSLDICSADELAELATGALLHDLDRKSTRLNSSHMSISYAVFCLKKKKKTKETIKINTKIEPKQPELKRHQNVNKKN